MSKPSAASVKFVPMHVGQARPGQGEPSAVYSTYIREAQRSHGRWIADRARDELCGRCTRGFTLVELLVAFALLGLLSLMFVWFIVPSMRMASLGTTRVDIQQMAVLACNRVATELLDTAPSGVSLHSRAQADPTSEPVVVAIVPLRDIDENGHRVWENVVSVFFWQRSDGRLLLRHFPPGPPGALSVNPLPVDRPSQLPTTDLLALANASASVVDVASKVVAFDVIRVTGGRAFSVELSIEKGVAGKQQAERFDYKKVVSLRN